MSIDAQRAMFEELGYVEGEVTVEYPEGTLPREITQLAAETLLGHPYIVSARLDSAKEMPKPLAGGLTRYTVTVWVVPEPEYLYEN